MGISGRMIQRLTRSRGIFLNRRPVYLSRAAREGDLIAVRTADRPRHRDTPATPRSAPALAIHFEDGDLLVLDKPAGIVVHPTRNERGTLADAVEVYLASRGSPGTAHPVHRLDRDTSGLILFAKTSYAHQALDKQLRAGTIEREYLAIVEGRPTAPAGTIEAPIGRASGRSNLRAVVEEGQAARTRWELVETIGVGSLVRLSMDTGRTHQIRVHLSHIGHPLLGDRSYGGRPSSIGRPALHSTRLRFLQPRSEELVDLTAPLPNDMIALVESLRSSHS